MKNIQLFETKAQAVGLEVETPYTASIDEQIQPVYGPITLGEKVTMIYDQNHIVVCAITEPEDEGYVDLGLPSGKLWASCNLGATSPCEYGNYYAWGETEPKSSYSIRNYKWFGGSLNTVSKYCIDSAYGTVDNKTVLDNEDDAVYVATSGEAHMPTKDDITELINNTDYTWCTCAVGLGEGHETHTIEGGLFTSKKDSSKKIFIPAAGNMSGSVVNNTGSASLVLSSSLYDSNSNLARHLYSALDARSDGATGRYFGCSVRGVKDAK